MSMVPSAKGRLFVAFLVNCASTITNPDAWKDYIFGDAGADWDRDGDPEWDCSGIGHDALVHAGIADERRTANDYANDGVRIDKPSLIGDYGCRFVDGHAVHIVWFVGPRTVNGDYTEVIEARGKDYGIDTATIASCEARGIVWFRHQAWADALNELAPVVYPWRVWFLSKDVGDAAKANAWEATKFALSLGLSNTTVHGRCVVSGAAPYPDGVHQAWLAQGTLEDKNRLVQWLSGRKFDVHFKQNTAKTYSMATDLVQVKHKTM